MSSEQNSGSTQHWPSSAFILTFPVPISGLILVKLGGCQAGKAVCSQVMLVARRITSLLMPFYYLTSQLPPLDLVPEPCRSVPASSIWPSLPLTCSLSLFSTWTQWLSFCGSCQVTIANDCNFLRLVIYSKCSPRICFYLQSYKWVVLHSIYYTKGVLDTQCILERQRSS